MSANSSSAPISAGRLILVPALITLAVTLVRLVGELQHWPSVLFNHDAGGGGAIVGITWLAPIFGIYFAIKLVRAGEGPSGTGRAIGFTLLALVVFAGGLICFALSHFTSLVLLGSATVLVAISALIPAAGWPGLFKVLLAYGYTARVPVVILMFFAISGHWGTHYDVLPPGFPEGFSFWKTYLYIAFVPQMFDWIAFTIITGSLLGSIAAIFARSPRSQSYASGTA